MKHFKILILLLFCMSAGYKGMAQANAIINVLTLNSGKVALNGVGYVQVNVGNTGPVSSINANKVRVQLSIPTNAIAAPSNQQDSLPSGWTIVSNAGSTITVCNGQDVIPVGGVRRVLIKVLGVTLGGPSTVAGVLQFGPGTGVCTGPGSLPGDQTADNTSRSSIEVCSLDASISASAAIGAGAANGTINVLMSDLGTDPSYTISGANLPQGYPATNTNGVFNNLPAGIYLLSYSNGSCYGSDTVNMKEVVTTFEYQGSPYCSNTGTVLPTIEGAMNGTFSFAPAGLAIDTLTGAIDLAASQAGTYVVSYSLGGSATVVIRPAQIFNAVPNQLVCEGATVSGMDFGSVAGLTYSWTNNNTVIGLAANGTGNIAGFTAQNGGSTEQSARIVVRAIGGTGCIVTPRVVVVTVAPLPALSTIGNQTVCAGQMTTAVNFTTAQGATLANWSNDNPGVGTIASATNSPGVPSFIARNPTGSASTVATFTVTPVRRGCSGTPVQFTITVNNSVNSLAYPQATYCQNTGALPILRGGAGGTYSATPAGLDIDVNTGRLNLWNSLAGTYTVTYTLTGVGGCNSSASTQVTVLPRATVTPSVSVVGVCRGGVFPEISFTGTGTAYNWTNSNTAIGLAASGSGNIASFVGLNATATVQRATVTVTAIGNGTTTCNSLPTPIYLGVHTCNAATVTQAGGTGGDASTLRTQDVTLSPVPARDRVTVQLTTNEYTSRETYTVQLVSQYGGAISKPAVMNTNAYTVDLSGLTPGVYTVRITTVRTGQSVQKQVVKL